MDRFDLNLVRTLVAVYETRSVTRAADRLDLTQPSVSHALGRLRQIYSDYLFVRGPKGLEPTLLASKLYERFSYHLAGIEETLEAREDFKPETSNRRFRIAVSDVGMLALGRTILSGLHAAVPRSEIDIQPINDAALEELSVGRIDVVIGNLPSLNTVTRNQLLFREHYVCMLASSHATIGDELTLEEFTTTPHIVVASPTPGNQLIDAALAEHHLARRVVIRTPHFAQLSQVVAASQMLAVLPSRVAQMHLIGNALRTLPLPITVPEFEVRMYWHVRSASSRPQLWLVEQLMRLLGESQN